MNEKTKAERDEYRESLKAWVHENRPDWLDERPAADWMDELKSKNTRKKARSVFPLFMGFIEMGPQEMYDRRVKDLQSKDPKERNFFEAQLKRFARVLFEVGYDPRSIRSAYVVQVQSFFAHNYMKLAFPKGAFDFDVKDAKTKNPPTNDEVRAMYKIADMEDRLMLHFLYQYGMSPVDVSGLRIEDVPIGPNTDEEFIYWEYVRDKTNIKARTALNPELVFTYRVLMARRNWLKGGWVFETNRGNRIQQRYIRDRVRALASKAGIEVSPKEFRDSFNEACLEAEMKQEIKDSLMGHKRVGARGTYSIAQQSIINAYKRTFELLRLDGGLRKSRKGHGKIVNILAAETLMRNPSKEVVAMFSQAYNFDAGTIEDIIAQEMNLEQMCSRLTERFGEIQGN